jgi:hypothetical protein
MDIYHHHQQQQQYAHWEDAHQPGEEETFTQEEVIPPSDAELSPRGAVSLIYNRNEEDEVDDSDILGLVLSVHALYHTEDSVMRCFLSQALRFTFDGMFKAGAVLSPGEKGLYRRFNHSPAHCAMMSRTMKTTQEEEEEAPARKKDDEYDYAVKPDRTRDLHPLYHQQFACRTKYENNTVVKQEEVLTGVVSGLEFGLVSTNKRKRKLYTRLQTLRLLWYVSTVGPEDEEWQEVRRMAFPHQGADISEEMCRDEWMRLLGVAVEAVDMIDYDQVEREMERDDDGKKQLYFGCDETSQ